MRQLVAGSLPWTRYKYMTTSFSLSTMAKRGEMSSLHTGDGIVRLATEADRPAIVRLSQMALGPGFKSDYVPGSFLKFLKDPYRLIYVSEANNEIVAFGIYHIGVDNGGTVQGKAARVLPGYQKHGYLYQMNTPGFMEARRRYPPFCNVTSTSTQTKYFDKVMKEEPGKLAVLGKRLAFRLELPVSAGLHTRVESLHQPGLQTMSPDDFTDLLHNANLMKELYPEGHVFINHNVYEAIPSNIHFLFRDNDVFFSSPTSNGFDAISVGGRISANNDKAWRVNFNYVGLTNRQLMLRHLVAHLWEALWAPPSRDDVYLIVMLPEAFWKKFGDQEMADYLASSLDIKMDAFHILHQYNLQYLKMVPQIINKGTRSKVAPTGHKL